MPDETRTVAPAMTPEDWQAMECEHGGRVVAARGDYVYVGVVAVDEAFEGTAGMVIQTPQLPALMALANAALPDGEPRKITRADVERARHLERTIRAAHADTIRDMFGVYDKDGDVKHYARSLADSVADLAAKLAALLPPEV